MVQIPAICNHCGTVFNSGLNVAGGMELSLKGNQVGPCPKCGGRGTIPDGLLQVTGDTLRILQDPTRTYTQLAQLREILLRAKSSGATIADIQSDIRRELPELQGLNDILPQTRLELYGLVELLILVIGLLLAKCSNETTDALTIVNQITVEQVMEAVDNSKKGVSYETYSKPDKKPLRPGGPLLDQDSLRESLSRLKEQRKKNPPENNN